VIFLPLRRTSCVDMAKKKDDKAIAKRDETALARDDIIKELRRPLDEAYEECSLSAKTVASAVKEALQAVVPLRITVPSEVDPETLPEHWRVVAVGKKKGVVAHTLLECMDPDYELRLKAAEKLTKDLGLCVVKEDVDGKGKGTHITIKTYMPEPKKMPRMFTNEKLLEAVHGNSEGD